MLEISKRSVLGVLIRKSGPLESAPLANQIQGFRIPDRYEAGEQNKRRDNIVVWYRTNRRISKPASNRVKSVT